MFQVVAESKRFGSIILDNYVNTTEPDMEKQFSAITYHLSDFLHYVAYRGTDASLVGWKENFNLSFSKNVPSQRAAVEYIEQIASGCSGSILAGGHSKGGNLAVYAAVMAKEETSQRLLAVYNHDGPGYLPEVFALEAFQAISNRIHKTVPQTAIVGLLLEHECYTVVASNSFAFKQHGPFSWVVSRS